MAFLAFGDGNSTVVNLLLRSEQFDSATWSKSTAGAGSAPVVTADAATAPDGATSADQVVFVAPGAGDTSTVSQDATTAITATAPYTGSVFIKAATGADIGKTLLFRQVGRASYTPFVLTANWQRVNTTEIAGTANNYMEIGLRPSFGSSSGTVTALLWGADLKAGSVLSAYSITTAGISGFVSLSNDYVGTPASRFGNWTPMTRPVGDSVTRLSDAALVMFVERTDYGASFELAGIPVNAVADGVNYAAIADRLIAWLLQGGTVNVQTGDTGARIYPTCGLYPGATPSLQLSDRRNLLSTLSLQLVNRAASPVRMDAVYR